MRVPGFLPRSLPTSTVLFSGFLLFAVYAFELAGAPTVLGPNKCTSCHDHDKQKQWADKDTHTKALEQLEDKEGKAKKYLAALGLSDPYNLKGPCVACHATVFNGDANAGVSCETCHGPGSAYLEPHQKKGSHKESVTLGLINTRDSYAEWARLCIGCHVVTDRKLTAAGHSSGADFELAAKSKKLRESAPGVKHWEPAYEDSRLADAGRAAMSARTGGMAPPKPEPRSQATALPAVALSPTGPVPAAKTQPKISPTPLPIVPGRPAPAGKTPARPTAIVTMTARPSPTPTPPQAAPPAAAATQPPSPSPPPQSPTMAVTAMVPTIGASQREVPPGTPTQSPAANPAPGIVIVIEVTPVPTVTRLVKETPTREIPTAAPPLLEMSPPEKPPSTPPPSPRPAHTRPRPRPTPRPVTVPPATARPQLSPTATPTRVPAPIEPPRRPPH